MPDPAETASPLIFDWSKPRRPTARLVFWLLITGMALAGFFFLFRVVFQTPSHYIPTTSRITLLSPNDPSARALLQKVSDRDFFVFANNRERNGGMSLDEQAPVFHPSFEKHELKLQDLPQRDAKPPPVRLLDVTEPNLPAPDLHDMRAPSPASPAAASVSVLSLHMTGPLEKRKIISTPNFSTLTLLDNSAWRFQMGVEKDGRVSFALPVATGDKATESAEIVRLLREVRFAPDTVNPAPMWGIATLVWSHPTTAP
jgi:hypothetical protein